jgi:gliding motility-associated-like protein
MFAIAEASHLVGGFLTYRWLGSNGTNTQYRVTLFVYRDCTRDGTADEVPFDDDIDLCVYSGDKKLYTTYKIKLLNRKKVQPVGNTNCPEVASACLEQGVYETTVSLPNSSTGYHLKWERCCRNTQNNLEDQFGQAYQGQTYYGFIPPTSIKNSSPYFQDIPVPFICKDDTTTIRNRAVDPDGDSLSYKLVTPWQGADANDPTLKSCPNPMSNFPVVEFRNGYSAAKPFGNTGIASIDAFNGLTTYLSRIAGRFAIAIEVTEWRNGVAISSVRLDLQILVINCSPNNKPDLSYEGGSKIWEIQPGEKKCWDVTASDLADDNQIITLRAFGDILTGSTTFTGTKATLSPATNANKKKVTSTFCWQPDCDVNTNDTFRVTFEAYDDGCPSKFINENALIKVKPPVFNEIISGVRNVCQNAQNVTYLADKRNYSNTLKWSVQGGTITGSDTANSILVNWGNGKVGRILLQLTSPFGCVGPIKEIPVNLIPAPDRPEINGADTVCVGVPYIYRVGIGGTWGGGTLTWVLKNATLLASANDKRWIEISWSFLPTDTPMLILYTTNAQGCQSIADTLFPFGASSGVPKLAGPLVVCPNNDNIEYQITNFDAKTTYTWSALGARNVKPGAQGSALVDWGNTGLGWLKVVSISRFFCRDTVILNILKTHQLPGQKPQGDTGFCEFTPNIPYKVNAVSGETYAWSVSGGSLVNGQNTPSITANWGARGNGFVGVKSTAYDPINNKECSSQEFRLPVTLYPIPTGDIFIQNTEPEQCQDNASYRLQTQLKGNLGKGDSLEIQVNNGLVFQTLRDANGLIENIEISKNQPGTFKVRARIISAFGCIGPWDEVSITINPKPVNTGIIGNDVICFPPRNEYEYQVNGPVNSTYVWNLTGGSFTLNPQSGKLARVAWDTAAALRLIEVQEISDKGCPGDVVPFEVDYDNPNIEARLVSVSPPPGGDTRIIFDYKVGNSPVPNGDVRIQRRPNLFGGIWSNAGTAPQNGQTFSDGNVNPDNGAYDYRAYLLNRCGDTLYTKVHTTVWLEGEKSGPLSMKMEFSPYFGFENGVARYELYRQLLGKGDYELYETYPVESQDSFENGEDNFGQRFRIKAYELGGDRESWSNDITLFFEPVMFVPNAFTPNGKGPGQNEIFKPLISGVKSYEFRIYNRWGEKLAEFFDESQGWDGTYGGSIAPEGIYVYQIQFRDFQDKLYQFSGTIHLLR